MFCFFVGAQTVVSLLQATQIILDVCLITDMLLTPAQIKPKSFESRRNFFPFFSPGVDAPHVYVRAWALGCFHSLTSTHIPSNVVNQCLEFNQYRNLSEGADLVGGQLRGDKECPFSGVANVSRFGLAVRR